MEAEQVSNSKENGEKEFNLNSMDSKKAMKNVCEVGKTFPDDSVIKSDVKGKKDAACGEPIVSMDQSSKMEDKEVADIASNLEQILLDNSMDDNIAEGKAKNVASGEPVISIEKLPAVSGSRSILSSIKQLTDTIGSSIQKDSSKFLGNIGTRIMSPFRASGPKKEENTPMEEGKRTGAIRKLFNNATLPVRRGWRQRFSVGRTGDNLPDLPLAFDDDDRPMYDCATLPVRKGWRQRLSLAHFRSTDDKQDDLPPAYEDKRDTMFDIIKSATLPARRGWRQRISLAHYRPSDDENLPSVPRSKSTTIKTSNSCSDLTLVGEHLESKPKLEPFEPDQKVLESSIDLI